MGSGYSIEQYTIVNTAPITLPIPTSIGNAIHAWLYNSTDEGVEVQEFKAFINNPTRVNGVIYKSAGRASEFMSMMLDVFYEKEPFKGNFSKGDRPAILGIRDGVVAGHRDLGIQQIWDAIMNKTNYNIITSLHIKNTTEQHAHGNAGVLYCDGEQNTIMFYLFEPHYPMNKAEIDKRSRGIQTFLSRIFENAEVKPVVHVHPIGSSLYPLQTRTDNCLQWSLLMALCFILNDGSVSTMKQLFNTLHQYRTFAMSTWLYFVEKVHGAPEEETLPHSRDRRRSISSDLDVYECHLYSQKDCKFPCEYNEAEGRCLNAALYNE